MRRGTHSLLECRSPCKVKESSKLEQRKRHDRVQLFSFHHTEKLAAMQDQCHQWRITDHLLIAVTTGTGRVHNRQTVRLEETCSVREDLHNPPYRPDGKGLAVAKTYNLFQLQAA